MSNQAYNLFALFSGLSMVFVFWLYGLLVLWGREDDDE